MRRRTWVLGATVLCGTLSAGTPGSAMQMVGTYPSATEVTDGRNTQYVVRFDALVDHRSSMLTIEQGGRVVETLRLTLRSDPKALAAFAPRLPPGDYQLHWSARSMSGEISDGSVPFTVKP